MKKRSPKVKGNKFEEKCRKTITSGGLWFSPLDLDYENHCIEVKYTDKKGFRITQELVEKIWSKALNMNKEPFLIIGLNRDDKQMFTLHCRINLESRE